MRMSAWIIPALLRSIGGDVGVLVRAIKKRDEEIEDALKDLSANKASYNERLMFGGRPDCATVELDEDTPKILVEAPPDGTSRLVNLISLFNSDIVSRSIIAFMVSGGEVHFLNETPTHAALTSSQVFESTSHPYVLEYGDVIWVTSTAAHNFAEPVATASFADDVTGRWHSVKLVPSDNAVTVFVPAPPAGIKRTIGYVGYSNNDAVTHSVYIGQRHVASGDIYWMFAHTNAPVGVGYEWTMASDIWKVLRPGYELIIWFYTATDTNSSHATAHYFDAIEDDSGAG